MRTDCLQSGHSTLLPLAEELVRSPVRTTTLAGFVSWRRAEAPACPSPSGNGEDGIAAHSAAHHSGMIVRPGNEDKPTGGKRFAPVKQDWTANRAARPKARAHRPLAFSRLCPCSCIDTFPLFPNQFLFTPILSVAPIQPYPPLKGIIRWICTMIFLAPVSLSLIGSNGIHHLSLPVRSPLRAWSC